MGTRTAPLPMPSLYVNSHKLSSKASGEMARAGATTEFEQLFLPHLNAAYNLARLLTRNVHDAEDVVQESYLRAFRAFPAFRGESSRPWLLAIVRNTAFTWLRNNAARLAQSEFDERHHAFNGRTPETQTIESERSAGLNRCIENLPAEFREAIVLREQEDFSYREISGIAGVPVGTVMSRIARARARLADCMARFSTRPSAGAAS